MKKTEIDVLKQLENKKYHKNYTPVIIVSIILTFVMIVGSVWLLVANLAPAKLGDLAYKINFNSYAMKLYERDYKNTGNIDSLYMALNIAIKTLNVKTQHNLYFIFIITHFILQDEIANHIWLCRSHQ